jgi:hypothetical protein
MLVLSASTQHSTLCEMSQSDMDIDPVVLIISDNPAGEADGVQIIYSIVAGEKPLRRSKRPKQGQMQCGTECAPSVRR